SRSTRVDLETTVDTTIMDCNVHIINTNLKGPLRDGLSTLLLRRSSASKTGLDILPRVIDADYEGMIKIMVRTISPPVFIPKGSKISQLVPFRSCVPQTEYLQCGVRGFDSTSQRTVYWAMNITTRKTDTKVTLTHPGGMTITHQLTIDTGADVTIIS
ncbi:POK9 protein, partial [Orthonyx spaldingii]|nr:POK9 protein [Orthonyx spaldingii]